MNILISGPIHFGKTTCAMKLAVALKEKRISIGGVLNPGDDIIDMATGEKKTFTLREAGQNTTRVGRFHIIPEALAFGEHAIEESIDKEAWTFIDECGKLELRGRDGYYNILTKVLPKGNCIVCIRDINVEEFFAVFGVEKTTTKVYTLNEENRDTLHKEILTTIQHN